MAGKRLLGLRRLLPRPAADQLDPEQPDLPEPEMLLGKLEREMQRQKKAVRLRKLRRLMEPRGPPQRTLTRQAMEQIRYLAQECPEDWPIPRLAQGFQVDADVIRRVLRSHFSPSPARGAKQDSRVLPLPLLNKQSSHQGLPQKALLAPEATFRLLPASSGHQTLPQLTTPAEGAVSGVVQTKREAKGRLTPSRISPPGNCNREEEEEEWDGRGLSKEELEELVAQGGWDSTLQVVQQGREFFDRDGNLLYRIPAPPQDQT